MHAMQSYMVRTGAYIEDKTPRGSRGVLWSISSESDKSATRERRVVCCPLISVGLASRA
jgi:hypothetical protein